jgi:hypothetical protein
VAVRARGHPTDDATVDEDRLAVQQQWLRSSSRTNT